MRILKALNRNMEGLIAATRHHHRLAVDLTKCHRAHPARVAGQGFAEELAGARIPTEW